MGTNEKAKQHLSLIVIVYIRFVMQFAAKLGGTRFLRRPEVDVGEVHVSGGLDVAAVVSTVAVSGHSRESNIHKGGK